MSQPWFSFFKKPYVSGDLNFFDVKDLPWVKTVEENYELIKKEMLQIINAGHELQPYRFELSGKKPWKTLPFISWGYFFKKNCALAPKTISVLQTIDGLVSASLSLLEAQSEITPHRGDTNAIVRSHFGIIIPAPLPHCGFKVGDEVRSWENGKVLPFCDSQIHSAWNHTDEKRYVMILDVMRPEFLSQQNKICATIIATHILLEIDRKIKFYHKMPYPFLKKLTAPLVFFLRFFLPLQKKFSGF